MQGQAPNTELRKIYYFLQTCFETTYFGVDMLLEKADLFNRLGYRIFYTVSVSFPLFTISWQRVWS